MRGLRYILAALVLALLIQPVAFGQVKTTQKFKRDMRIERQGNRLVVSFDCPEVFSDRVRNRLSSGFTSRVVVELQLIDRKRKTTMAQGVLVYNIRYEIWEERFAVRVEDISARKDLQLRTMEELVDKFGSIRNLPLMTLLEVASDRKYQISAQIVVNPVSPELRKRVRRYLANPNGHRPGTPPSFFGSFSPISGDEKKIQADAVLKYRSRPMKVPAAKKTE